MMKNTEIVKAYEETLPNLYVDVRKIDDSGLVWYPIVIDKVQQGKGIIFANGTNKHDWVWTYAPSVLVEKDEQDKFKTADGKYLLYKTNMKNAKNFNQNEFSLALTEMEGE
jgi:hypothetical protein